MGLGGPPPRVGRLDRARAASLRDRDGCDVPGDERPDAEELSEEALVTRFIDEFDAEEVPGDWLPEGHDGAADAETLAANEQGA